MVRHTTHPYGATHPPTRMVPPTHSPGMVPPTHLAWCHPPTCQPALQPTSFSSPLGMVPPTHPPTRYGATHHPPVWCHPPTHLPGMVPPTHSPTRYGRHPPTHLAWCHPPTHLAWCHPPTHLPGMVATHPPTRMVPPTHPPVWCHPPTRMVPPTHPPVWCHPPVALRAIMSQCSHSGNAFYTNSNINCAMNGLFMYCVSLIPRPTHRTRKKGLAGFPICAQPA